MPDYKQGKIYKIINHELKGLVYYGSTAQTLKKRLQCHKYDSKRRNNSSKIMFSVGYPEIILLEYYPCETKQELEARERVFIEGNECVNIEIPGRTKNEWNEDNKEKLNEKRSEKTDCQCGGKYTQANKSVHLKSKKHIKFSTQQDVDVDHVNLPT